MNDLSSAEWPYPIEYDMETEVSADVLVLGGGIAGCWAAITAARKGAKVAIVEKAATVRSGAGGAGCDHWGGAVGGNPLCPLKPEEKFVSSLACLQRSFVLSGDWFDTRDAYYI